VEDYEKEFGMSTFSHYNACYFMEGMAMFIRQEKKVKLQSTKLIELSRVRDIWYSDIQPLNAELLISVKCVEDKKSHRTENSYISCFDYNKNEKITIQSEDKIHINYVLADHNQIFYADRKGDIYRQQFNYSESKNELIGHSRKFGYLVMQLLHYPNSNLLISAHNYGKCKSCLVFWDLKHLTYKGKVDLENIKLDRRTNCAFLDSDQLIISTLSYKPVSYLFFNVNILNGSITELFARKNIYSLYNLTVSTDNKLSWIEHSFSGEHSKLMQKKLDQSPCRTLVTIYKNEALFNLSFFKGLPRGVIDSHIFLANNAYVVALKKGEILLFSNKNKLINQIKMNFTSRFTESKIRLKWHPYRETILGHNDSTVAEIAINLKQKYLAILNPYFIAELSNIILMYLDFCSSSNNTLKNAVANTF
jgi:hypothetical protein